MPQSIKIPFGKHLPDQAAFENPGSPFVNNVIPASGNYRPFSDIAPYSNALDARAQGAVSGRETSGNVYTFAGDATKLYKLSGQVFNDASRLSGGAYATPGEGGWTFIPWSNDILIGLNGVDDPQKINPVTGNNFEELGGSPPHARHGAVVGDFVFIGNWAGNENWVAWSGFQDAEGWTQGDNQSSQRFIPSGGPVQKILGGEVAIVFCTTSIHRFSYAGSPLVFSRDEIGPGVGLLAPGSVAQFGNIIFFIGQNSFYRMDGLGNFAPIGESRWNKTFFAELNQNHVENISSAIDPINTIWLVAYPSTSSTTGLPDRIFLYNWAADDCAFATIDTEYLFTAFRPGTSLDDLTSQTGFSLDDLPFSLDSGVWQGGALVLGAFDRTHKLGFFAGSTLEATMDTVERDGDGQILYVSGARPLVDTPDAEIAIKHRFKQGESPAVTAFSAIGADGTCPHNLETRYTAARMRIPAGSTWSKAQGIEAIVDPAGEI